MLQKSSVRRGAASGRAGTSALITAIEGKTPGLRDGLGSGCGEKGLLEDTCSFDSSI